ncbi:MAG: hypothetical protein CVU00_07535 [Bacteroidetes bacterium HGW-Bacteroidetes-17]|jgi:hypothetical protein|nr:MAG: hypothetical protein CVU00_07535 [Bacteroidetes bacterium HGW-Bacteroidetes-17]
MKKAISIISLMLFIGIVALSAQNNKDATTSDQIQNVKAYYFHANTRCVTCKAVEAVAKEAIEEYYGDKVSFVVINREEDKDNPLVQKYEISGQTLLIVKGEKVVNLTNEAFLNARTNPDKLKGQIKSTIDSMI